ncbi:MULTISPECIES: TetR/AcrR family transcriptional regulator [unclassified Olleya]|jgi:AcrR family transcriptional regulator|uniref:TetR/AcrR family transcriptional regulator n=1 Tax=unclassified Olleya TaxID=2615019 RepID=UPI0011A86AA9|nr:TetR/AcrR family transcriptional regulator [Olleya sp. Hel_I_94]TVZ46244.1 TetR family transcriptional regulator [Olleya sp. Hel_I_94]
MARTKQYNETEVVEKAMHLFWKNGYETTSMQMLEKEMGINKFSIYSSFGNKHGLFLESLKLYRSNVSQVLDKLKKGTQGVEDIKQFFYHSVSSSFKSDNIKGCFVTNTYNEFSEKEDECIQKQMNSFMDSLKSIIIQKLKLDTSKNEETIAKQANYLLLAKHGLAAASRVNTKEEIEDYIEMVFKNL